MKYRQKPEYFIVEELAEHNIVKDGAYKLYSLVKEGVETFSLLARLSKENKIPYNEIGIAGIKDKHAKTSQYISLPKKYSINDPCVTFLGYINLPIKIGDLKGNRFKIIVTELTKAELKVMYERADTINEGILNYFDSQRFGNIVNKTFITKHLINKEYETAVKYYLESNEKDKERIMSKYKQTKSWIAAYKQINTSLRTLFVSAYQSYIWNECIKELVKGKNTYDVPYAVGSLRFLDKQINLPQTFSTISHKLIPEAYEEQIIAKVLQNEGLKLSDLNIRQTGNFFKSNKRNILVVPQDFKVSAPQEGEMGYTVSVEFSLPKGSYATIVLKKLFGK